MKEIKFRAWDGEKLRYPNLINTSDSPTPFTCYTTDNLEPGHFDAKELMQFTGLKENAFESGNKDIYESDVIEFINGERLVVEWNDDTCQFQYSDGTPINNGERYGSHKIIVGNIYENPELLK